MPERRDIDHKWTQIVLYEPEMHEASKSGEKILIFKCPCAPKSTEVKVVKELASRYATPAQVTFWCSKATHLSLRFKDKE